MRQCLAPMFAMIGLSRPPKGSATARSGIALLAVALLSIAMASGVIACQVPVFRYAIERWPADNYELLILHHQLLGEADEARLKQLKDAAFQANTNLEVDTVQVADSTDPFLKQIWDEHQTNAEPLMVVLYPKTAREVPDRLAAVLPFNDASVEQLALSPVRAKIAKRLSAGESAVWIFVPSGQADQDAAALQTLTDQLKLDEQRLMLPSLEEMELEPAQVQKVKIELRLGFSAVTLDRDDAHERVLLQLLLGSEPDLESLDEPMAFPVLGRGRVLYALVGAGISDENIRAASSFIVGPCSCQVKNQNPGFDLLLQHDWETAVGEIRLSEPLPEEPSQPSLRAIPPGRAGR
ncbi:MAG: hypothetical protein ACO1RT_16965 [Planctomycetaceae bacterium]